MFRAEHIIARKTAFIVAASLFLWLPAAASDSVQRRVDAAGVTRAMYNLSYAKTGTKETQLARSFLVENAEAFRISDVNSDLTVQQIRHVEGGSHIRLAQTYQGIPVHNGEIIVSTNGNGGVAMVINNYKSNLHLPLAPKNIITSGTAIASLRATFPGNARLIGKQPEAELMVWQDETSVYHYAYRVRLTTENPSGDWEAFVDVTNGKILQIENRFANASHVQGSGYVYLTDPLSAAKKRYGSAGFVDNNDADSDSLNCYRTHVILDSLTFEDGVYKLKGPYCEVTDVELPTDPQFYYSTTPNGFTFTRSRQEFEAVNVYYHVSKSYQYIQSLGFSSQSLTQVRLDPHGFQGADNSHYSPNGNWIGWGEGGVDDAEDVDAILHEYGHAIVFNFCPSWGGGESGALGEGYSDYWAASSSRQTKSWAPADYEYNWVYNWNSHNLFQMGRSVNDSRTYPFGNLEIHDAGQIWSSTLMSIWKDLGKEVTDKLVLKSLHYLGGAATGVDAAQALLQADRDLFGGTHISTLAYCLGTVKHFINPENYLPTINHSALPDIILSNWAPIVSAQVSQNSCVDSVWVEYKINSGNNRAFVLSYQGEGIYRAQFDAAASELSADDTVSYRIFARYVCAIQAVGVNPGAGFFSFKILNSSASSHESKPLAAFELMQNYPNPFNPSTNISYILPEQSYVSLRIYNILGQIVATLVSGVRNAGTFTVGWNGTNDFGTRVATGTYVYRLETQPLSARGPFVQQKKLTLIK